MTGEELEKQVNNLMGGKKAHRQTEIVEIKTREHTRRGLLHGIQTDGKLCFSWIPDLAKDVKRIKFLDMDIITHISDYEPSEIISINHV